MSDVKRSCADCGLGNCSKTGQEYPAFCLTTHMEEDLKQEALQSYTGEDEKIMKAAALVEYENYCKMTRVEETMDFCRRMGYRKIGIATCVGLLKEAGAFAKILRHHGFEVFGIACKAGAVRKTEVGIDPKCEEIGPNMCNPILQAKMLNKEKTDFNVVIGLCVGHDSLFYKHSEAPVTTLIAKDRVLAHNPVGALYQCNAYYAKKLMD